jgi:hypothetical protein
MKHEVHEFAECSLFNSSHSYRDGYDCILCTCGWKSAPARGHAALVLLCQTHAANAKKSRALKRKRSRMEAPGDDRH